MDNEWQPANDVESTMASALERGDAQRYGRLLTSTRWYLPVLAEAAGQRWQALAARWGLAGDYVVTYTSVDTLRWVLGELVDGYETTDFAAVAESWPDQEHRLAVNPGTPIAVFLPIDGVESMAEGRGALAHRGAIADAVSRSALDIVRRICLSVLDGPDQGSGDTPVDELEARLRPAVEARNTVGFLSTLLEADVIVLAGEQYDPAGESGFPWWTISGPQLTAIPVFSSLAMVDRTARGEFHPVRMPFVEVVANWPDVEYLLCFNLGTGTELILPGAVMPELANMILQSVREGEQAPEPG